MNTRRIVAATSAAAAVVLTLTLTPAAGLVSHTGTSRTRGQVAATAASPSKASLLHPKKKYFGVFVSGAPASLSQLKTIKQETGKEPNLDVYYQDWGAGAAKGTVNFSATQAKKTCAAGILPMYTWESWNTSVTKAGEGAKWAQPAFSVKRIIAGHYDAYIRNTAQAIRSIGCPIAVRLDQEWNGYWYPWGLTTKGMGSQQATPARYAQMWRHVWRIFHNQHANNVLWVWSPNYQGLPHKGLASLKSAYPGSKYVDWIGIDGYYLNNPKLTFSKLFGTTMDQLQTFASNKPWIVSETAVGTGSKKPAQITNLLDNIASRKQFNGFVYFDFYKAGLRSNWPFQQTAASLRAFKKGIAKSAFATAKAGSL